MAGGGGQRRRDGDTLVVRLPVDADHPVRNAVIWGLIIGAWTFGFVVFDRRGLGGPVAVGLPVAGAAALVGGAISHAVLRRRTKGHRLVLDDDGIAFAAAGTTRWRVPWDTVHGAQIVDGTLVGGGRHQPSFATFVALDLDPEAAPDHPSLPRHDGRWWFSLLRAEAEAPLVGQHLRRRIPGRVERARHQDGLPHQLATREGTRGRVFR